MKFIMLILLIFIALLPTSIILSKASYLRGEKLWAWRWTVLASIGGLGIIALSALISLSIGPEPDALAGLGVLILVAFVLIAWVVQLVVIGIVALARRTTKHVAARAFAPSETPDDSPVAPAEVKKEAAPRVAHSYALWIVLGLIVVLFPLSVSDSLGWWMHVVGTPVLPLALAFIVAGHRWRAHVWAAFWYIVAVPGAIGLVIRLFPSLVKSGALLEGLRPGHYVDWAYIYPVIFVLAAFCGVVTLNLWQAKANPMWRWAFTWASIGYVYLALLGLIMWY